MDPTRTFDAFSTALQSERGRESRLGTLSHVDASATGLHVDRIAPRDNIARTGWVVGSVEVGCAPIQERAQSTTVTRGRMNRNAIALSLALLSGPALAQ